MFKLRTKDILYFSISFFFLLAATATAQVTAIRAGKLIDPDDDRVLTNQIILVRANKIEAVGANISIPAGANVIDLSKYTVLPGLIDCHTHLADGQHDSEPMSIFRKTAAE